MFFGFSRLTRCQLAPKSIDTSTRLTRFSPAHAAPRSFTSRVPAASLAPFRWVNTTLGNGEPSVADLQSHGDDRRKLQRDTEWGLQAMAQETGGVLMRNQNDLSKAVGRVLDGDVDLSRYLPRRDGQDLE